MAQEFDNDGMPKPPFDYPPLTRKEIIMLDLNDKWEEGNAEKIIALVLELKDMPDMKLVSNSDEKDNIVRQHVQAAKSMIGQSLNDDFNFWSSTAHNKQRSAIYGAHKHLEEALK